ncbi:pseudaminic acid synthase [Marivirga sp.]|uniref:pseudaminic acid synthase n=1 Tax=Marivirga sp. TaxID=2018662 RepID=UPI002D802E95|nr:pseudaminic acid synthase [Marivirga sp.]HET8858754.1 pseudaminic acid synthase [Marivirga sp.]
MDNKNNKVYIIAELSANHNNDYNLAVKTIEAMASSGADAVKVQTYTPDSLTLDVDNEYFGPRKEGLWKGRRPYELFEEAAMPYEWQPKLKKVANDLGMEFFSSPFDLHGVDFLENEVGVPRYKIASLEITDIPLIEYTASKGKPIIISTGVAELADIELAVHSCRKVGNNDITLLKCTSEYPAPFDMANLLTIPNLKETFNVKVGVSDHTMGSTIPIVSVALGATVVEKHFILDRSLGGPDSAFSMEPNEFADMVQGVREAEEALGKVSYEVSEKSKLRRRSLFVAKDIKKGEVITEEHVRSVRPGHGMHPKYLNDIIGKIANSNAKKGTPLHLY